MNFIRIVIFAKAPRPGFAKTRLIPTLGPEGAARLARQLLQHTLHQALLAGVGPVELCVTPSLEDPVWRTYPFPDTVRLTDQGAGDLGQRLSRAAQRVTDCSESVLLIGTDCPELTAARLQRAAHALCQFDATLIPAVDGGYTLLGLNHFHPAVFSDIPWSTDSVARETLARLARLGRSVEVLPALHDIDEPSDLQWLDREWWERDLKQSSKSAEGAARCPLPVISSGWTMAPTSQSSHDLPPNQVTPSS